jgi:hypothetical protein
MCLSVEGMPAPSRYIEFPLYADDRAIIAMPHQPKLFIGYPQTYLSSLEHCLWYCRIAIRVSKSTVILFVQTSRCI